MGIAVKYPHEEGSSVLSAVIEALAIVPHFFVSLARASSAAHAADRLFHLSDAQLAQRGLSRDSLGKHICETYLID